jgi:hypothetical protein
LVTFLAVEKSNWFEGIQDKTIRTMARSVLLVFYIELKHALRLLPSRTASARQVSHRIPSVRPTFLLQPKKVGKKGRSPNYVLHPIILDLAGRRNVLPALCDSICIPRGVRL